MWEKLDLKYSSITFFLKWQKKNQFHFHMESKDKF
jgi:hypothetical protein